MVWDMLTLCTMVSVIRYSKNNRDTKTRWGTWMRLMMEILFC